MPSVLDAERMFALVVTMLALAVAKELPNDDEAFKTVLLVVRIDEESELDALARLVVSVESEVALAKIDAESDDDAEPIILLVPVIAERTDEIGLVRVSLRRLPTDPGVAKVEVAAFQI